MDLRLMRPRFQCLILDHPGNTTTGMGFAPQGTSEEPPVSHSTLVRLIKDEALAGISGCLVEYLSGRRWGFFGSFALYLRSGGATRSPADVDIEVWMGSDTASKSFEPWTAFHSGFECEALTANRIRFSNPERRPVAYWQTVLVVKDDCRLDAVT